MQRSCQEGIRQLAECTSQGLAAPKGLALLVAPKPGTECELEVDNRDGTGNSAAFSSGESEAAVVQACLREYERVGLSNAAVLAEVCSAHRDWRRGSQLPLQGWQAHQLMCARCGSQSVTQLVPFYVLSLGKSIPSLYLPPEYTYVCALYVYSLFITARQWMSHSHSLMTVVR